MPRLSHHSSQEKWLGVRARCKVPVLKFGAEFDVGDYEKASLHHLYTVLARGSLLMPALHLHPKPPSPPPTPRFSCVFIHVVQVLSRQTNA